MKNIIVTPFALLVIGIFLNINPAIADDRFKVFELAESGITIEFPMTDEEIAAEDADKARLDALKETSNKKPQKRVNVFEMGESGQIVTFPMTASEIVAEDAENARLAAIRKANSEKKKMHVVSYELAESGISIEFPAQTPDKAVPEAITERKIADDLKI